MDPEVELHAIFSGRVQGVGFRWQVLEAAETHQLRGRVKNLLNGSVEVIAQGTQQNLDNFLKSLQNDPGAARITSVKTNFQKISHPFSEFKIVH